MSKENSCPVRKTSVGGQALIEGILMRGPKGVAMSVRLPNGEIETEYKDATMWRDKNKFFGLPLVRGIVGFVESLYTGYKYLMESAEKSTQGLETPPEEQMSKLDKWLEAHFGEKMMNAIDIAGKYGFTDIRHAMFYRERVFAAEEYLELLGTYSDHIAIEESIRNEFFAKIENAINEAGGTITITDTMDLELARKA